MKNRHAETVNPWKFDRVGGRVTLFFLNDWCVRIHFLKNLVFFGNYRFLLKEFKLEFISVIILHNLIKMRIFTFTIQYIA